MADYAWIKAHKVDRLGNTTFKGTGWNFNGIMASMYPVYIVFELTTDTSSEAAKCTIVEAEEIVEVGEIPPEQIHLPGLYVSRVFKGAKFEHKIEVLKYAEDDSEDSKGKDSNDIKSTIAKRAAKEFFNGMACNLGVGIPTMAAGFAAQQGTHVNLQSENGMMGVGAYPKKGEEDSDWINAGKESILPIPGASTFGSDESFAQIRGGHLDMTVLGALECSQYGDIANFMIPGKMVKGMGGAMDLVSNPEKTKIMVVQTHQDKHGRSKIKKSCALPLTGAKCVHTIVTELAVFDVDHEKGLTLREYNPNSSIDEIKEKTDADFQVAEGCKAWEL